MKKNEEIEGRSLSGPPDGLMALGRVKNWCTNTQGAAKHNRFNFNNWKEIGKKKWNQYKGGQRQQWKISAPRHEIYFSESESGWWNRWSMQRSQYERQGLLVGWPTNQDNKRANSVHLTPCNSHLDELTNIYKCKTWASDAVTWYTQVRKEGTLSLIWHPINIVQIEYPRGEVHMLLSGYHWRSAHERLIFNPNLHLSPMAFPRGIFDLDPFKLPLFGGLWCDMHFRVSKNKKFYFVRFCKQIRKTLKQWFHSRAQKTHKSPKSHGITIYSVLTFLKAVEKKDLLIFWDTL